MPETVGTGIWSELAIRGVTLRNRLGLAPMSLYCADAGVPTPWHVNHYVERSHTVGLTIVEATGINAAARVTPGDLVLDGAAPVDESWRHLADAITRTGSVPGIQLCHGGRKSSRGRPWEGDRPLAPHEGGWTPVGPSEEGFAPGSLTPRRMSSAEIAAVPSEFAASASAAVDVGFRLVELHAGHGRLLHSFYSARANTRDDEWGGTREARARLLLETVRAVRAAVGEDVVVAVRLSCTDWVPEGWTMEDSVWLADRLSAAGCDLVDCTSGGIVQPVGVPRAPGYQVPFASAIRRGADVLTAAVGEIATLDQAEVVVRSGSADVVLMGRTLLLDPYYPARAADRVDLLPPSYRRGLVRRSNVLVAQGTPEL